MSTIHYAVEIDTGDSTYTDSSIGVVNGILRYITDRPGYNGGSPYPTWGSAERESGNVTSVWYEGFLSIDGVGQSSVSTDLTYLGSYSTTSSFSFVVSGAISLLDEIVSNDINIVGKAVKFFVVIDDVFYQRWGGIVDSHSVGEDGKTTINCTDNFQQLHKTIPPIALNKEQFPDIRQSDEGKSIPVCLGDVPYAKVQNAGAEPAWQQLCTDEIGAESSNNKIYAAPIALAAYDSNNLVNLYLKTNIPITAGEFVGMYAFVVYGSGSDASYGVRISYSTDDVVTSVPGIVGERVFRIIIEHPFSTSVTDINNSHLYSAVTTSDIWWIGIANLSSVNAVSNDTINAFGKNASGMPILKYYNNQTGVYDDISGLVKGAYESGTDGWAYPEIKYVSKSANISGDVSVFNYIPINEYIYTQTYHEIWYSGLRVLPSGSSLVRFEKVYRTGDLQEEMGRNASEAFDFPQIKVRIPEEAISSEYSDLYVCLDFLLICGGQFRLRMAFDVVDAFGKTISVDSYNYYKRQSGYDLEYDDQHKSYTGSSISAGTTTISDVLTPENLSENAWATIYKDDATQEWIYIVSINGTDITIQSATKNAYSYSVNDKPAITMGPIYNFIPTDLYEVGASPIYDTSTLFGVVENISGTDYSASDFAKVPSSIIDAIASGYLSNEIGVTLSIENSSSGAGYAFLLKNIAMVGRRGVNTINGGVYCTVRGEMVSGEQTNNPPAMIKKILEDYDGIPSTEIDYHTIAYSGGKSLWYGGGQLTKRKSSFDYLNDICRQFWIAMFPSRLGKRKCADWLNHVDYAGSFTQDSILRGTIGPIEQKTDYVYNEISVSYGYSPGHKEYMKRLAVINVDKPHYPVYPAVTTQSESAKDQKDVEVPDGTSFLAGDILYLSDSDNGERCVVASISGDVLTMEEDLSHTYAISSSLVAKTDEYVVGLCGGDAIALWNYFHSAYIRFGSKSTQPDDDGEMPLIPDYAHFGDSSKTGSGSSAYYHLLTLSQWVARPKPVVKFSIPINNTNIVLDLSDLILFADTIEKPNGATGWVQGISLDPSTDSILVEAVLEPDSYSDDVPGDIIEIGNATSTVTESGLQTDTITEDGV